ncbi:MAG: hypothetical protein H6895_05985 [Defluviimonas sp.]|uniref:hypothetical protein n=1 Tax=Albidovulum sp. TaxID=1872424 RepID=UPI002A286CC6|nr:hypothetical protein [Defluviimonas sp.]
MRSILSLALLVLAAAPAGAFTAENGLVVRAEPDGSFSVPWRGPGDASAFWCAAGDYAIRALHAAPTARVWRITPVPRPAGAAMRFSMRPDGAAERTGLLLLGGKGAAISAGFAASFCDEQRWRRP